MTNLPERASGLGKSIGPIAFSSSFNLICNQQTTAVSAAKNLSLSLDVVQHASRTNGVPLIAVLREVTREIKPLHVSSALQHLEYQYLTVD